MFPGSGIGYASTAAYDPNSEPGADLLWIDASAQSTYTVVSTRITQFTDRVSGSASYAQGTSGNQATAEAGGATDPGLNGFADALLGGSVRYTAGHAAVYQHLLTQANNPYTLYLLVYPSSGAADYTWFSVARASVSNEFKAWGQNAAGRLTVTANDGASKTAAATAGTISANTPQVWAYAFDGTNVYFYKDGAPQGSPVAQAVTARPSADTVGLCFRCRSTNDQGASGKFGEVRLRNAYHDAAAVARVTQYLRKKWQLDWPSITVIGDSLSRRNPLDSDPTEVLAAWLKKGAINRGGQIQTWNLGINGNRINDAINGAGAQPAWRGYHGRPWSAANTYLYVAGGTNDLFQSPGRTPAQLYTDLSSLLASARSEGYGVAILETITPRTTGALCPDGVTLFETHRQTANGLYLANAGGWDHVTNGTVALEAGLSGAGELPGVANTRYVDGAHLTALGYSERYAALIALTNSLLGIHSV